jgi:hypothetical protein
MHWNDVIGPVAPASDEEVNEELTMLDTAPVTTAIRDMIVAGTPEGELLARVVRQFPDLTVAELSQALQEATAAADPLPLHGH